MNAIILDGKQLASKLTDQLKLKIDALTNKPCLAVCLVGDDPASNIYVNKKHQLATELGIKSIVRTFPADIGQEALESALQELDDDNSVHGILLQLPLPRGLDEDRCLRRISAKKDVDGLHYENLGRLLASSPQLLPCTPYGIMSLLDEYGIEISGRRALVIGRSRLVGKPIAQLLLNRSATISIAHSQTPPDELIELVGSSDIIVSAVGKPQFLRGEWLRRESVLIDVGINRNESGKLVGDLDWDSCLPRARAITPVPGGIGPLTVVHLMMNTLTASQL